MKTVTVEIEYTESRGDHFVSPRTRLQNCFVHLSMSAIQLRGLHDSESGRQPHPYHPGFYTPTMNTFQSPVIYKVLFDYDERLIDAESFQEIIQNAVRTEPNIKIKKYIGLEYFLETENPVFNCVKAQEACPQLYDLSMQCSLQFNARNIREKMHLAFVEALQLLTGLYVSKIDVDFQRNAFREIIASRINVQFISPRMNVEREQLLLREKGLQCIANCFPNGVIKNEIAYIDCKARPDKQAFLSCHALTRESPHDKVNKIIGLHYVFESRDCFEIANPEALEGANQSQIYVNRFKANQVTFQRNIFGNIVSTTFTCPKLALILPDTKSEVGFDASVGTMKF